MTTFDRVPARKAAINTSKHAYRAACTLMDRMNESDSDADFWPRSRGRTASTLARLMSMDDIKEAIACLEAGEDILLTF